MYILVSIFAFSLLGTVSMIGYKTMALRRSTIVEVPAQTHSLEHHFGAFLRTFTKRYTEKIFFWFKVVCVPVMIRFVKNTITLIVHIIKYIGMTVSQRIDSLEQGSTPRGGASSFFLKDITEHKKNLKKDEHL
ncbi:MAG: hypothetical protein HZB09_01975 [Candidatus Yonathbacteria bacterium]|nr:hypothetical protein [Candidatus Yonathbacteria bacterium]